MHVLRTTTESVQGINSQFEQILFQAGKGIKQNVKYIKILEFRKKTKHNIPTEIIKDIWPTTFEGGIHSSLLNKYYFI